MALAVEFLPTWRNGGIAGHRRPPGISIGTYLSGYLSISIVNVIDCAADRAVDTPLRSELQNLALTVHLHQLAMDSNHANASA
jgi:hypothetical protein